MVVNLEVREPMVMDRAAHAPAAAVIPVLTSDWREIEEVVEEEEKELASSTRHRAAEAHWELDTWWRDSTALLLPWWRV